MWTAESGVCSNSTYYSPMVQITRQNTWHGEDMCEYGKMGMSCKAIYDGRVLGDVGKKIGRLGEDLCAAES